MGWHPPVPADGIRVLFSKCNFRAEKDEELVKNEKLESNRNFNAFQLLVFCR
jgi:hypothetical protein